MDPIKPTVEQAASVFFPMAVSNSNHLITLAMTRFETEVLARSETMSDLTDTVMTFLSEHGVDTRATHHAALVLEEILGNLATHGNCRDIPAKISVRISPNRVIGEVIDGGPAFDPRLTFNPPVDGPLGDRPIGGVGLHLVRQFSSHLEYERKGDENFMSFAINRT